MLSWCFVRIFFAGNDNMAIGRFGVILLMVILGSPERAGFADLRDDVKAFLFKDLY